ncbi:MAG: HEAT repeat domain-containing protein [Melioribacteraceae bacterium]|nr:HEAT repeat domain-containing protein [Melioribacteraceae bacterium]
MKLTAKILAIILFISLLTTSSVLAGDKTIPNSNLPYDLVEENLLVGLKSDNYGLHLSSAFMLGEIKSERAIIPLTQMLRMSQDEKTRLVAALSLIKIGTDRSIYVVKDAIRFNDFEKVSKMCAKLYNGHIVAITKISDLDAHTVVSFNSLDNIK